MTARLVFESALIELNKIGAPSLLLSEYNYYINKAIRQYINKLYNIYDVNLQTTDSLRVLKSEARMQDLAWVGENDIFKATYEITLPDDYVHLLNCICIYDVNENHRCYDKGNKVAFPAKRLTADSWSDIMDDYYNRPLPERPYYYIHNVNLQDTLPTNKYDAGIAGSTDLVWTGIENGEKYLLKEGTEFPRTIKLNDVDTTVVVKPAGLRYSNPSKVRLEVRYGYDNTVFALSEVRIDYIKSPQTIRLTKELVDKTRDESQIMEFPDYVCQEIINELVILLMHKDADPRLLTQQIVTQSIAPPAQQLTQLPQARRQG